MRVVYVLFGLGHNNMTEQRNYSFSLQQTGNGYFITLVSFMQRCQQRNLNEMDRPTPKPICCISTFTIID